MILLSNRDKIGWVIPLRLPYATVMASTRLRVYDVMRYLRQEGIRTEFYNPLSSYRVVIFQKAFERKMIPFAQSLKRKGVRIIFDINVNYIDDDAQFVTPTQKRDIYEMLRLADHVITPSPFLRDLYARFHGDVRVIEEIIEDRFFQIRKEHRDSDGVTLLFCGYAVKSEELREIRDILQALYKKHRIKLLLICEKKPHIDIIPYEFIRYDHHRLPRLLLRGDIKISPRDMSRKYNWGHAFTRIGYPMSAGLPVVASPVPSYRGSPALLCDSMDCWRNTLEELVTDPQKRELLSRRGCDYVRRNFTRAIIIPKYIELLKTAGAQV